MVPGAGVEPARACAQLVLSQHCLPISAPRHFPPAPAGWRIRRGEGGTGGNRSQVICLTTNSRDSASRCSPLPAQGGSNSHTAAAFTSRTQAKQLACSMRRHGRESNPRIRVLQTLGVPLAYRAIYYIKPYFFFNISFC